MQIIESEFCVVFSGMKRQLDRETPPKLKRSHQGYVDYDVRDRDLAGGMRERREGSSGRYSVREGGGGSSSRGDYDTFDRISSKRHLGGREERTPVDRYRSSEQHERQPYRTLCCSNLNPRASNEAIRDELYNAFKRFNDFNVRVVHTNDQKRIAFVNFCYPDDARSAAHSAMNNLVLFDMPVRIETVYNNRPYEGHQNHYGREHAGYSEGHTRGGGYDSGSRDRDYQGQGGYRDDRGRRQNNFRDGNTGKFPYHLNHIEPEDDDKATRTLFVGNLDIEITEDQLRSVFERYGTVDDIDIKRPQQGNAYAFIKFFNLDMAHRAKVSMSGEYIGKFQCKIGYGKPSPSPCLWVGGLGQWLNVEELEREFDRFGVIHRIEWPHGKSYAYVLFDNVDAATAALKDMRGFPLGGTEHRLRVDFADLSQISGQIPAELREQLEKKNQAANASNKDAGFNRNRSSSRNEWTGNESHDSDYERSSFRGDDKRRSYSDHRAEDDDRSYRSRGRDSPIVRDRDSDRGMLSPSSKRARLSPEAGFQNNGSTTPQDGARGDAEAATSVGELARCLPVAWQGTLMLKNRTFVTRLHLVSGDARLVESLMVGGEGEPPVLRINQRLRLDQAKVDDVRSRLTAAGPSGHSVLLALDANQPPPPQRGSPSAGLQQRPLKDLVSYLKQKEAAGIIALPPKPSPGRKDAGVLHACPPCAFGNELLTQRAPRLTTEANRDDYLVIVVVLATI